MTERVLSRRQVLKRSVVLSMGTLLLPGHAAADQLQRALKRAFGDTPIQPGRVTLALPALAENGNSVRLTVRVDSIMRGDDRVAFVQLFSPANPLPDIARFDFSAASGLAEVETRIRIAGEQDIVAVAGMVDGSLWSGSAHIVVTEAACLDALI